MNWKVFLWTCIKFCTNNGFLCWHRIRFRFEIFEYCVRKFHPRSHSQVSALVPNPWIWPSNRTVATIRVIAWGLCPVFMAAVLQIKNKGFTCTDNGIICQGFVIFFWNLQILVTSPVYLYRVSRVECFDKLCSHKSVGKNLYAKAETKVFQMFGSWEAKASIFFSFVN